MKYDTMEAGLEFNILVAEKVMGCIISRNPYSDRGKTGYWFRCECGGMRGPHNYNDDTPRDGTLLDFSGDIAAAMQVVNKMGEKYGFTGRTGFRLMKFHKDDLFRCMFPLPTWSHAVGETAALAICRAALKAVDEK